MELVLAFALMSAHRSEKSRRPATRLKGTRLPTPPACGREFEQTGIGKLKVKDCDTISDAQYEQALRAAHKDAQNRAKVYCVAFGGDHCPLAKYKGPKKVDYRCEAEMLTVTTIEWFECVAPLGKK